MSVMERIEAAPPPPEEPAPIGSEAHKRPFCRTPLDTDDPYRPALIDWPALDEELRAYGIALEPEPEYSARAIPNGRSCAPAIRGASTAFSGLACFVSPGIPGSSRRHWSTRSSR